MRISLISRYARLRPIQFLGPSEKGLKADDGVNELLLSKLVSADDAESDSQRDGSNAEGAFRKLSVERFEA